MELTTSHALQGLIMLATLASGYAIVKNNLSRVMHDLEIFKKSFEKHKSNFDNRLDDAESQRAVFSSQIDVLKQINSVAALSKSNREMATILVEISVLKSEVEHLKHIHNSKHPNV
jgi:predicted  nucleic acid-binding Zn-ribbon protein